MFEGSCVALVTPMDENGEIDKKTLSDLVDWHISEGTQAMVIAGTTGESPTLSWPEQQNMIKQVVSRVNKRIPVIAGTGTNSTKSTLERTLEAKALGVEGCLVVAPYYNRPTQEGLKAHFETVATKAKCPLLLYNVPARTACDILPATVSALSEHPFIVGIKEATGDIQRLKVLKRECHSEFTYFSGDDPSCFAFIEAGGKGVISITANIAPLKLQTMCGYALSGEWEKARTLDNILLPLHRMLVVEPNPIPVKWALEKMGRIQGGIRLPLTPLSDKYHNKLKQALQTAGVYTTQLNF